MKFCTYCPEYICHRVLKMFPPYLKMRLHYLVKLKFRVFVKTLMLQRLNSRTVTYDFDFTY